MRKTLFITVIALLVYAWAASASKAATFRLEDGEICDFSLNGRIEPGDAQAFVRFLSDAQITIYGSPPSGNMAATICLNSPGGSLVEAAEIAEIVFSGFATRIRAHEQCLSACAWIFMLGRTSVGDDIYAANRSMSVHAALGFHAPSIPDFRDNYSQEDLDNAVNAMNEAFSVILDLAKGETPGDESIGYDLIQFAMATPIDDFYLIQSVGQVLRWQIDVFDLGAFDPSRYLTRSAEYNACDNARRSLRYYSLENYSVFEPPSEFAQNFSWREAFSVDYPQTTREQNQMQFTFTMFGMSGTSCEGGVRIARSGIGNTLHYQACHDPDIPSGGCINSPLALFPGDTPLVALAGAGGVRLYTELTTTVAPEPAATTCHLEGSQARITNVNQYTNLRSGAGITQPIVTRVPLNARVTQARQGLFFASQRCLLICYNGDQRQIAQCIESNDVWIEVTYNGRRGFLSRQFLEAP